MAAAAAMCCSHRAMARGSGLLPLRLRLPGGGGAAQRAGSQPAAAAACGRESGTGGTWRRPPLPLTGSAGRAHGAPAGGGERAPSAAAAAGPGPGARRPHGPPRCPALPCGTGAAGPAQPARRGGCITQACAGARAEAGGGEGEGARGVAGEWRREASGRAGGGGSPPGPGRAELGSPVRPSPSWPPPARRRRPRGPPRRRGGPGGGVPLRPRCRRRPGRGSAARPPPWRGRAG